MVALASFLARLFARTFCRKRCLRMARAIVPTRDLLIVVKTSWAATAPASAASSIPRRHDEGPTRKMGGYVHGACDQPVRNASAKVTRYRFGGGAGCGAGAGAGRRRLKTIRPLPPPRRRLTQARTQPRRQPQTPSAARNWKSCSRRSRSILILCWRSSCPPAPTRCRSSRRIAGSTRTKAARRQQRLFRDRQSELGSGGEGAGALS